MGTERCEGYCPGEMRATVKHRRQRSYFQRRCYGPKMSQKEFHILCKNRCGDYLGTSNVYCHQMILIFCVRIDVENIEEYPM